jgi:carbon storage regulator CsrA
MLTLGRKEGEEIVIDVPKGADATRIVVRLGNVERGKARIGVDAPKAFKINRREVADRDIKREEGAA